MVKTCKSNRRTVSDNGVALPSAEATRTIDYIVACGILAISVPTDGGSVGGSSGTDIRNRRTGGYQLNHNIIEEVVIVAESIPESNTAVVVSGGNVLERVSDACCT